MLGICANILDPNGTPISDQVSLFVISETSLLAAKQSLLTCACVPTVLIQVPLVALSHTVVQLSILDLVQVEQFFKLDGYTLNEGLSLSRRHSLHILVHHLLGVIYSTQYEVLHGLVDHHHLFIDDM